MLSAGKIESWQACKADAIKRDSFWPRRQQFLQTLPEEERERLSMLSSEARDDTKGEVPGTERSDEEERLFMASLSKEDRDYLEAHKGLGNSQKAEVAWLEKCGYEYEEVDVRDFYQAAATGSTRSLAAAGLGMLGHYAMGASSGQLPTQLASYR